MNELQTVSPQGITAGVVGAVPAYPNYNGYDAVAAWNSCDTRHEVAKSESDIRQTIFNQTLSLQKEGLENRHLLEKSIHENRFEMRDKLADLERRLTDRIITNREKELENTIAELRLRIPAVK